jgi:hypothetical protein
VPSNTWNRIVYRAWAPLYDRLLARFFLPGREAAARALALRAGSACCWWEWEQARISLSCRRVSKLSAWI